MSGFRRNSLPASVLLAGSVCWLVLAGACATTVPEAPKPHVPVRDEPFFLDPLAGYPLASPADLESRVRQAWALLRSGGDLEAAAAAMEAVLEEDPGFHPARVLSAQIAALGGDAVAARDALSPVADELPGYLACQVLLGKVAEDLDDLPVALAAFRRASEGSSAARERAAELEPRVIEILVHRVGDFVDRGRFDEAGRELAELEEWAGDRTEVLGARRRLAAAEGDVVREIEVLRELSARGMDDDSVEERLAELYLITGEIRDAIDTLEVLVARAPDDEARIDKLQRAKFLWRIELQPQHVREIASKSVLTRAELATLLYWLVPSVRYAEVTDPPIATDILDHPRREEILPVMFLGLIPVDETLHRFSPEQEATRASTLSALLGLLGLAPTEFSCVGPAALSGGAGPSVCRKAARCRLIPEVADCLPGAQISGPDALDLFRRTLDLLGSG